MRSLLLAVMSEMVVTTVSMMETVREDSVSPVLGPAPTAGVVPPAVAPGEKRPPRLPLLRSGRARSRRSCRGRNFCLGCGDPSVF